MLSRLKIAIEPDELEKISFMKSSIFQGVIMERIDPIYAQKMHSNRLHPYSQKIINENAQIIWQVATLNEEGYEEIIQPLLKNDFQDIMLLKEERRVHILKKQLQTNEMDDLLDRYYFGHCSRMIRIRFQTPTAFKSSGRYVFYPDLRLIYQSLMMKYDACSEKNSLFDERVLDQLIENTEIRNYKLKSISFPLEGIRIPAFIGELTLKIHGPGQLVNLANMMFRFGEYSGIGIKTAIGMGGMQIVERKES